MKTETGTTKKKRITLDDLAAMLKRQFDHIDERFKLVPTRDEVREIIREENQKRIAVLEDVVLNDHRFRIRALEREVGID